MAKPQKAKVSGSGSSSDKKSSASASGSNQKTPPGSARYTPPTSQIAHAPSPMWVPVLMWTFLGTGFLMIILNYAKVILPGATSGWYLLGGLGLILAGIMTATQYR